jgi:hypothetical protein
VPWLGLSMRALPSQLVCVGVDLHARHWPMMIWASPSHLVCVGVDLRAMGWLDDTGFALALGVCWNSSPCQRVA